MSKKLLRKKLALMLANLKKKRKYFCEVEFLESTGTQYIDTGIIPNINTECSMNVAFVSLDSTYRTPFSVRTADGATNSFTIMSVNSQQSNNSFAFGSNYWSGPSVPKVVLNKTVTAILRKGYASWDGVSGYPGISITPTTLTAYMFARNANGTAGNFFMGKIYKCTIKDGDTLVRDFIPVLGWDGKGYMYDKVSGQLFGNAGTGDFTAGREIHPVEYLESTGTQYINTGIKNKSTLRIEAKFNQQQIESKYAWVFGGRDASIRGGGFGFGYNSESVYISDYFGDRQISTITAVLNTDVVVDKNKNVCKITTNNTTTTLTNVNSASSGDYNITLFALNNAGTVADFSILRLFYSKIWDNGVLVRDFIPAISEDGTPFMFDRVTHTCFLNAGQGQFRYPAREVEYLESTGAQHINTGFAANLCGKIHIIAQSTDTSSSSDGVAIGCGSGNNRLQVYAGRYVSQYWSCREDGAFIQSTSANIEDITNITLDVNNKTATFNNEIITYTTTQSVTTDSLLLFKRNPSEVYPAGVFIGKIYGVSLWNKSNELIRDFIPCYKDGQAGMLDKLTGTLYTNQGTGAGFTVGKIVEPEYE